MIAYLDSSVLLRIILNQEPKLKEFTQIEKAVTSKILKTECLRAIDRINLTDFLTEQDYLQALELLYENFDKIEFIDVSDLLLNRACISLPFPLGTLDAIHLVSAIYWQEKNKYDLKFLTHDMNLGKVAKINGFQVLGLELEH